MSLNINKLIEVLPYCFVKDRLLNIDSIGTVTGIPPEMTNMNGERIKVFYLKDNGNLQNPYSLSSYRYPRRILWDRFNYSLNTHFYVHECMFERKHESERKYGILRESEVIIPNIYSKVMNSPEIVKEYDMIFTHSERILDRYENACFAPAGYVWYGMEQGDDSLSSDVLSCKTKNISIIASNKSDCEMQKIRAGLARYYSGSDAVDSYGTSVGNYIRFKSETLKQYRYSIVIENDQKPYYFTEKILDCFASMTIPIYFGATKIGDYFNSNGIVQMNREDLNDFNRIDKLIRDCNCEDYQSREDAVKDNFDRVQEYLCYEDYLDKHYLL